MSNTVIYHRADFDGIFCREIAKKFLPEAKLIGWDYGDPLLEFPTEGTVYVLDLSPECFQDILVFGQGRLERLIWIDHHKTAIDKFMKSIGGYRIDGVAACRLAWQWFTHHLNKSPRRNEHGVAVLPDKEEFIARKVDEPYAVRLAGEYDIWDKRDPNAELFQHGLRSEEVDIQTLLQWPEEHAGAYGVRLLNQGRAIQYVKTQENKSIIEGAGFTIQFEGFCLLACNAARYNSQLFAAGLKPEHDGCLGFNWDGKQWRVSLYTDKPGVDLSTVAVKYGGGGHRGACGFRAEKLPFLPCS